MKPSLLTPEDIRTASRRITPYIRRTPLMESALLNSWLGHTIVFKVESHQKIGAFKARGAINALLKLKEEGNLPKKIVAYSSGNHAQAVSWAGTMLGIDTTIYLPSFVSSVKKQATRSYGAKVVETKTRMEAEAMVEAAAKAGAVVIPPYDNDDVIAGQGTACLEALEDGASPDAVFAPIGGGGLISGTFLANALLSPKTQTFAAEPLNANDAARSLRDGKIFRWPDSPQTLADGARTLAISERTFYYLKQCGGIFEITEEQMIYWTQWLTHLLKVSVEPTCAMGMAAAFEWLKTQEKPRRALVIISGGNIAPEVQLKIWQHNHLEQLPKLL